MSELDLRLALEKRLLPTVVTYNRIEGRPRTRSFDRALRAEVRDALWMLTRQWQLGELEADDAGSPIATTVHVQRTELTSLGARDEEPLPFAGPLPLETRVERRPVVLSLGGTTLSLDLRLAMGRRWLKLLASAPLSADHRGAFVAAYGFVAPDPTDPADTDRAAHRPVHQAYAAVAGRAMDGGALYAHLVDGGHAYDDVPGVPGGDEPVLDALAERFVAWFERLVVPPGDPAEDCWDPQRLEYRFRAGAPGFEGGTREYVADGYHGGRLDWWAMDVAAVTPGPVDPLVTSSTSALLPTPVTFEGMPATRWWELEDRRVNLGQVDAATTDLATMLFLEFALVYANDWFLVPVDVPVGSILQADGVAVTTVFGERFWVPPAGSGEDDRWQRWSMFSTSLVGPGEADTSLLVLPVAAKVQEGEPLEEVALVRDEMANMVWGVESVVPSPEGGGMPGGLTGGERLAHLRRLAGEAPPEPAGRVADVRYEVMGSVPEHWVPFVPVHVEGSNREIQLQRAALPRVLPGQAPVPVEPRTALLRHGLDAEVPVGYLLHEEEVPSPGIVLRPAYQRTRALGGAAVVWVGVGRRVGRGGASSGLAFDRLVDVPPE